MTILIVFLKSKSLLGGRQREENCREAVPCPALPAGLLSYDINSPLIIYSNLNLGFLILVASRSIHKNEISLSPQSVLRCPLTRRNKGIKTII